MQMNSLCVQGYPTMIHRKQMEKHDTKEVYFTEEPQSIAGRNFQVIAELYPSNVPQSSHRPIMEKDLELSLSWRECR
jgi:hypothetical protein